MHNGIESIDHPVIASDNLDEARVTFERLGFTIPPRGSHVEWGTGNLCIMFPDDYLEIRGIIDASRFTMHLDEHLDAFGEGLMGVAFSTADVQRSHGEMLKHGIDAGDIRTLTRNFEHADGWTQPSGGRGRKFESSHPDQISLLLQYLTQRRREYCLFVRLIVRVLCESLA